MDAARARLLAGVKGGLGRRQMSGDLHSKAVSA